MDFVAVGLGGGQGEAEEVGLGGHMVAVEGEGGVRALDAGDAVEAEVLVGLGGDLEGGRVA